jgi:hypothetical protein
MTENRLLLLVTLDGIPPAADDGVILYGGTTRAVINPNKQNNAIIVHRCLNNVTCLVDKRMESDTARDVASHLVTS